MCARTRRGLSLIEALLALAVMGFGMLAVLGMQSTLRQNGDQARQRSEAMRLAQDEVELWRAYSVLDTTTGRTAYQDLVDAEETIAGANATYVRRRFVSTDDAVSGTETPRRRLLIVQVGWEDRTGDAQLVQVSTTISESPPELAAAVVLAGDAGAIRRPLGRHPGIPRQARDLGDGRSGFVPPGQSGGTRVAWRFDNVTGVITLCTTVAADSASLTVGNLNCGTAPAQLVQGFVRYATSLTTQPVAADLVDPQGPPYPPFSLQVVHTEPAAGVTECFLDGSATFQSFYCAVPVLDSLAWTGALLFGGALPIAADASETGSRVYRVCRYHEAASYTNNAVPLANQNFVLIRAGDGSVPFVCPTSGTPRTWPHQPPA
jgi:Tfp pilus assembly protein PilV